MAGTSEITFTGKFETCLKPSGLYLTADDPKNPNPNGGLIINESNDSTTCKQAFSLVRSTDFPPKTCMIVTHPKMDLRLRMSDRVAGVGSGTGRIVEIVPVESKIEHGLKLQRPKDEFLFEIVERDGCRVFRCWKQPRLVLSVAGMSATPRTHVVGEVSKNGDNEKWRCVDHM